MCVSVHECVSVCVYTRNSTTIATSAAVSCFSLGIKEGTSAIIKHCWVISCDN